ncbi:MAG: SDR family oxidoreductase [Caulobacterales bacterium]|nr:SDR family oxidoreductase [Caulobacterales bacterium]
MEISAKTAIITGGASGLGEGTARRLARLGARVAIFDVNDDRGQALAAELGDGALYARVDVTDEANVAAAIGEVETRFSPLHICLNFAGIGSASKTYGKDGPHELAAFRKIIDVNLIGTFNVLRLAASSMAKNDPVTEDGQRGVIINTASIAAYEGQVGQVAYSASKGGVVGMTLPIARDLAPLGIRCNTIVPGLIHTPMFNALPPDVFDSLAKSVLNPRRLGTADEIARTAQYTIENDYVNGECIRVDGGIRMQPR